jgi:hypothetical protein
MLSNFTADVMVKQILWLWFWIWKETSSMVSRQWSENRRNGMGSMGTRITASKRMTFWWVSFLHWRIHTTFRRGHLCWRSKRSTRQSSVILGAVDSFWVGLGSPITATQTMKGTPIFMAPMTPTPTTWNWTETIFSRVRDNQLNSSSTQIPLGYPSWIAKMRHSDRSQVFDV